MARRALRHHRLHSLWRLRAYLRPHTWPMLAMLAAACAGVGLAIAVPLVAEEVVNGPIAQHQPGRLLPIALLALALGAGEAVAVFTRRWIQAGTVLQIETQLRDDLYQRLQRLPVAFHDKWQSGQLLSRAITDLSTIRRFSGFGLVFLVVNVLTYLTVVGLLVHLYLPLGLLVAATTVPIVVLSARFERQYIDVSRRLQDQQGDLATVAEECAQGVHVIKSFGRRRLVGRRFDAGARDLY